MYINAIIVLERCNHTVDYYPSKEKPDDHIQVDSSAYNKYSRKFNFFEEIIQKYPRKFKISEEKTQKSCPSEEEVPKDVVIKDVVLEGDTNNFKSSLPCYPRT